MSGRTKPTRGASRNTAAPQQQSLQLGAWLAGAAWSALLVLTIWVAAQLADYLDRPITEIRVNGELTQVEPQAIRQLVLENLAEGVLTAELQQIHARVMAHPWVERAAIRRQWPGVLQIYLVERVAVARWDQDALLTESGAIFQPRLAGGWLTLPQLSGPDTATLEVLAHYRRWRNQLEPLGLALEGLRLEERGAWQLSLRPSSNTAADAEPPQRVDLLLGRQDLPEKLARFSTIYRHALAERVQDIERIDLRYTNGLAVRWKAGAKAS